MIPGWGTKAVRCSHKLKKNIYIYIIYIWPLSFTYRCSAPSHSLLPSLEPLLGCPHRPLLLRKSNAQIFSFPVSYQNLHFPEMHFRLQSSHSVDQGDTNCPSPSDLLAGLSEMETSLLTLSPLLALSHFAAHPVSQPLQSLATVKDWQGLASGAP